MTGNTKGRQNFCKRITCLVPRAAGLNCLAVLAGAVIIWGASAANGGFIKATIAMRHPWRRPSVQSGAMDSQVLHSCSILIGLKHATTRQPCVTESSQHLMLFFELVKTRTGWKWADECLFLFASRVHAYQKCPSRRMHKSMHVTFSCGDRKPDKHKFPEHTALR